MSDTITFCYMKNNVCEYITLITFNEYKKLLKILFKVAKTQYHEFF